MSVHYRGRHVQRRRRRLNRRGRILLLLAVLCCAGLLALLAHTVAAAKTKAKPEEPEEPAPAEEVIAPVELPEEPDPLYALTPAPETLALEEGVLQSEFAVFADAETGQILSERNSDQRMYPASMTKVMTLLVAAEHLSDRSGSFTMTRPDADYCYVNKCSVVGYEVGEEIPVNELFYGCILCSGADACLGLAYVSAGGQEPFVEWMNEKAEELGIADTCHFTNCVGLYDPEHYCTARDIAVILHAAMEDAFCRTVLSTPIYHTQPTEQHPDGQVLSNWFLRRMEIRDCGDAKVLCGKTGYVPESGNCAVSYGEDTDGHGWLCVTGKAGTQWLTIADHALLYRTRGTGAEP